jgi:hypothetical protein
MHNNLPRRFLLGLGLITLLIALLFCGVSRDPEFYEPTIFVKHRPTLKVFFFTPIGESDLKLEDLEKDSKREELLYQEFVVNHGIYTDNLNRLWFVPPILIQLTLTFLSLGVKRVKIKKNGIVIHFLINVIFSAFVVAFILHLDELWRLVGFIGLMLLNILTTKLVERKNTEQQKYNQ